MCFRCHAYTPLSAEYTLSSGKYIPKGNSAYKSVYSFLWKVYSLKQFRVYSCDTWKVDILAKRCIHFMKMGIYFFFKEYTLFTPFTVCCVRRCVIVQCILPLVAEYTPCMLFADDVCRKRPRENVCQYTVTTYAENAQGKTYANIRCKRMPTENVCRGRLYAVDNQDILCHLSV